MARAQGSTAEAPEESRIAEESPTSPLSSSVEEKDVEKTGSSESSVSEDVPKDNTTAAETSREAAVDSPQGPATGGEEKHPAVVAETKETHGPDETQTSAIAGDEKDQVTTITTETDKATNPEENEDDKKYPTGIKLGLLVLGLAMSTFVIALDNTIIATAIPRITTDFDALNDVGWYGSSYLLTTTSLQPSFGKVYAYFDVKYTYLSALAIFEVGSIICAAATGSKMLIVGRAVAGAGAAALFSGGMTIVGYSVPLRKRAIYIAALSSMFGIG